MKLCRIVAFLFLTIGAVSCVTTAKYKAILNTWRGYHYDSLVSSWGPPTSSTQLSNGGRVVEYSKQSTYQTGGYSYPVPVTTHESGTVSAYGMGGYATGNYSGTSTTYGQQYVPPQTHHSWCKTRFTISEAGIIQNWSFEGNGCRSR